jgi:poly-gamma-glutamate synthesis protein (capsule biosynthesis protein)
VGDFCPRDGFGAPSPWTGPAARELIGGADLSVVNLEGAIAGAGEPIPKCGPCLAVDAGLAADLPELGFRFALLANNHTGDFGPVGLAHTLRWCEDHGLGFCGAGPTAADAARPAYLDLPDGTRIGIVAACEYEFGLAVGSSPGTAWRGDPAVEDAVRAARERADVVVVSEHGGCEYVPFPPVGRREQLRRLVDAGADLVLGGHPHVAQGWETWKGGLIFFSLGNFYFPGERERENRSWNWSLAVRAVVRDRALIGADVIPLEVSEGNVVDVCGPDACEARLAYLRELSDRTRDELPSLWQAAVKNLWESKYSEKLSRVANGFGPDGTQADRLLGLNMIRCEAHRSVIETWLSVSTGDAEDVVTPEARVEYERWLERMNAV